MTATLLRLRFTQGYILPRFVISVNVGLIDEHFPKRKKGRKTGQITALKEEFSSDKDTICLPRHHLNQLRFALRNHDKSRSKQQLLPIYYFFEFRYDDKNRKSSPGQEVFLLFGTAFCLSAVLSKTCIRDRQTHTLACGFHIPTQIEIRCVLRNCPHLPLLKPHFFVALCGAL